MLVIAMLAALSGQPANPAKMTWDGATDPYEQLLDCYGAVMRSKGLGLESPDSELKLYDALARRKCATQIRAYRKAVGDKDFEKAWYGLWGEYWSRD